MQKGRGLVRLLLRLFLLNAVLSPLAFAAGGSCPSGANYLSPSNPVAAKVTLSSFGVTSCFYIAANGSDTNTGTDEAHPWQHAPGMPNCTSNCNITPVAGEGFIFRGGDTWHFGKSSATPYTGGTWTWSTPGTSSNAVYIGVDPAWYSGASWNRPILNSDNPTSTSGVASCTYTGAGGYQPVHLSYVRYLHFDNFEMLGMCWNASNQNSAGYIVYQGAVAGNGNPIYMENLYIHGWTHVSFGSGVSASVGAFAGYNQNYGGVIQFDVVDGSDSDPYSLSWEQPGAGDGYIVQYNVIRYNGGDNSPNQCHIVHDNLFEYGYNANDGTTHTDWPMQCYGEYAGGSSSPNLFYNNIVRHIPGSVSSVLWQFPPSGQTDYNFNNVFEDYEGGGDYNNYCQGGCGNMVLFNNTEEGQDAPSPVGCIHCNGNSGGATITSTNSQWIVNSGNGPSAVFQAPSQVTETNAVYQTLSTANGQGYTLANDFSPTSASGATVTASGTNQTNGYCTQLGDANAAAACLQSIASVSYNATTHTVVYPAYAPVNRPSSGVWNIGAYQYVVGGQPNAPTNLTAVVQ
jgi:hypothetical protein